MTKYVSGEDGGILHILYYLYMIHTFKYIEQNESRNSETALVILKYITTHIKF
jgi:hypothetical protein